MIFAVGDDDGVRAAHADAERLDIHTFIAYTDAAETENAAGRVVVDKFRPFFFRAVNFFFDEAAGIRAIAENHVLQFALAAFVANGAVEGVIGKQKFQDALARLLDLVRLRPNDHSFGRDERARRLQLRHFFHFDKAHTAGGLQRKP